jgi:hypothetical protein
MREDIVEVKSFGDVRTLILQTIMHIRDGGLTTSEGMAMAANFKELNSNIQCEINAAKLAIQTENSANSFGKLRTMGATLIGTTEVKQNDA